MLSPNPSKRAVERFWLWYTPVWGAVCGVVMLGGFAERWRDAELLAFGLIMALPACLGPLWIARRREPEKPFAERTGVKLSLAITAFSLLLNYTQTPFFFDVLHAHFGFHSTVNIQHNPVFLYFLTIAYFSTYAVLLMGAYRLSQRWLRTAAAPVRALGSVTACFVVAALENVLNANPFIQRLYCFDDMGFAMGFGSLAYGISFVCVLPVWIGIDEHASKAAAPAPGAWLRVLSGICAAVYVDSLALDVLRHHVAPRWTEVHAGATGLGDFEGSCLSR